MHSSAATYSGADQVSSVCVGCASFGRLTACLDFADVGERCDLLFVVQLVSVQVRRPSSTREALSFAALALCESNNGRCECLHFHHLEARFTMHPIDS